MNIELNLPATERAALEQAAAKAGIDVEAFIANAVRDRLELPNTNAQERLDEQDWNTKFEAWADSFPASPKSCDDSRENIYPDRG